MTIHYREDDDTRASLELLYHISRELATALDLRTVLQRVILLSMQNVGAMSGSIIVMDDVGQPVESVIIVGARVLEHTTEQLRVTLERGLAGWVAQNQQAVLISDTTQDERWLQRPDDALDRTGPKSAVSAPLMVRDRLIGVLTLVHPTPGIFTPSHLSLVQAIADQAGIAIFNARLYEESQRKARVMSALAESAAALTASLDLEEVLQRILAQTSAALRVEAVLLALLDTSTGVLTFQASTTGKGQSLVGRQLHSGQGIAGWVAQEGRGMLLQDPHSDPHFDATVDQFGEEETHAIACAPITSQGQVIGVLEAFNPLEGSFDPDALQFLTGISSLAGTAIRHAQLFERLQAAHERYLELFEDSIDPILITDHQGRIVEANRQAEIASDYSEMVLLSMSIEQLHLINLQKVGANYEGISPDKTLSYEINLHAENGRQVPVQVYVRGVKMDGIPHFQWILHDITERKNLDSLRDDLISMIYHDLRSPLANVVSSLDVFESMLPEDSDPAFRSLLKIALRSTERIQRLTSSLLDISRLEAGQPIGNLFPASPLLLAGDVLETIEPVAENKGISLTIDISADLPMVMVDADMIRRLLSNLLENAVKFTPPGGQISVNARLDNNWVQMGVHDTGTGIPMNDRERIFNKYTRLDNKGSLKGYGLGLAYCRIAVEGHGGRIWVEGPPNQGARFCFTLPVVSA